MFWNCVSEMGEERLPVQLMLITYASGVVVPLSRGSWHRKGGNKQRV